MECLIHNSSEAWKAYEIYQSILRFNKIELVGKYIEIQPELINNLTFEILDKDYIQGKNCLIIISLNSKIDLNTLYSELKRYGIISVFNDTTVGNSKKYLTVWV